MIQNLTHSRLIRSTWAIFIVLAILILQNLLTQDISFTSLSIFPGIYLSDHLSSQVWNAIKLTIFIPVVFFWILGWREPLDRTIILSNSLLTLELFVNTFLITSLIIGPAHLQTSLLIMDTLLVMVINLLVFSLWYWIIDSPSLKKGDSKSGGRERWDFIFPQRMSALPGYSDWIPGYLDYFYLAFTTTFTFGPADTIPLSKRAKILMTLQVTISVINIVVLAGYVLGALA